MITPTKYLMHPIDFDMDIKTSDEEKNKLNLELFLQVQFDGLKNECLIIDPNGYLIAHKVNGIVKPFTI